MPWCPKCKNEYREGITVCADCGVELVASLDEGDAILTFGEKEQMERLQSFLEYNKIEGVSLMEDPMEHVFELRVPAEQLDSAKHAAAVFMVEENKDKMSSGEAEETPEEEVFSKGPYKNNAQKAEEFRSSGYVLVIVGALGLIFDVMIAFGVVDFAFFGQNNYLAYGVMGFMFLAFLIIGIRSFSSAKTYSGKIEEENQLKEEILSWAKGALTKEAVDAKADVAGLSEEESYFKRFDAMKQMTNDKFMNLDSAFVDSLMDDLYPQIFGE